MAVWFIINQQCLDIFVIIFFNRVDDQNHLRNQQTHSDVPLGMSDREWRNGVGNFLLPIKQQVIASTNNE